MRLSLGLNVFWVLHFQNSPQNIPYCNTTKTYLRGELFDKGGGAFSVMSHLALKFSSVVFNWPRRFLVWTFNITNLLEPFYHPADAESLFLGQLLGDYAVHLPE